MFDLTEEAADNDETTLLKLFRRAPIFPRSITDDGDTLIVAQSAMGGQRFGAIKFMNKEGKSRTLVPYGACGAKIHDDKIYCLVNGAVPKITVEPVSLEGDMTDDETTLN